MENEFHLQEEMIEHDEGTQKTLPNYLLSIGELG